MNNILEEHIDNIYKNQLIFINKIKEFLNEISQKKFYCYINKNKIFNLHMYYFEEIIENQLFLYEKYNYENLIFSYINKIDNLDLFISKINNKKYLIKYDIINNKWSLIISNTEDNFCYVILNFICFDNLINYFKSKLYNKNNNYSIVPYLNIKEYIKNKYEEDYNELINEFKVFTINKKVIKKITKK